MRHSDGRHRFFLLGLGGVTAAAAVAMPTMAMPVLFSEMSEDLGLSVVQIGAVWGTVSLAGLFTSLLGGTLADRFGARKTLSLACLVLGMTGALRGLSTGLLSLSVTVFLNGLVSAILPMNLHKVCGIWFSGRRLGMANSVISGSMALGFMTGAMLSASVLAPWLGSWRGVLMFYGGVAVLIGIPWAFARNAPVEGGADVKAAAQPIRETLRRVARIPDVWLLGLALLAVGGAVQGFLGYLPMYLREVGWEAMRADMALASFHAMSLVAVLPLAYLSDRLHLRRGVLAAAAAVIAVGIGLLSIVEGVAIWIGVLLAGSVRDGFMGILMTSATEIRGVGALYAGTALGLVMTLQRIGGLIAPPLGNALAVLSPRMPFALWAAMGGLGMIILALGRRGDSAARRPCG